ncbi:MAG: C69 family dipeptidase [Pirellulales bacterium]|nr:C69 family dipeptidase [Pirellulales bacterium]
MRVRLTLLTLAIIGIFLAVQAQACTSIMVGRKASADGSVMTSHTCDSHRDSSVVFIVPPKKYSPGTEIMLTRRVDDDSGIMERYARKPTGKIPQVSETYGYISAVYGIMNEHQLAIGESTFEGLEKLQSDEGLIDCETLTRLMLERAKTAREAIRIGGELIEKYGWCDLGEALTIADTKEVWLMEIVGPGKGEVGAAWVARRVPDDHVSVIANGARIGEIDLSDPDFMASKGVAEIARRLGLWDPNSGEPFRFYEAYSPESRLSVATTRREWRALDFLAPSLKLHPGSNHFPFSVKPEKPVEPERIMEIFRDTFEGTDYDMTKDLTITDEETGKTIKSPLANPFMPYEMNKLLKLNGGWGWMGERPMARWYCMYVTVTQSRGWLPDAVGGVVWLGYGNPAMTTYVPIYAGVTDLPEDYKTDGRTTGFSRRSAWWAFNRADTLAAHRWGDMRKDVAAVRDPIQQQLLADQQSVDARAAELLKTDVAKAREFLTKTTHDACRKATDAYWDLGDLLWTKYDEKW